MPDKKTIKDTIKQSPYAKEFSALVDGEFQGPVEHLLHSASCNKECQEAWRRYYLMRDVMQRDYHPALGSDFAAKISDQIANEDSMAGSPPDSNVVSFAGKKSIADIAVAKQSSRSRRAWLPVAGLGLAASVAAAGFMAWQLTGFQETNSGAPIEVVAQAIESTQSSIALEDGVVPAVYTKEPGIRWLTATAEPRNQQVEQRLNSLLINHLEDSTMGRVQGMLAHSRVVSYDSVSDNESF